MKPFAGGVAVFLALGCFACSDSGKPDPGDRFDLASPESRTAFAHPAQLLGAIHPGTQKAVLYRSPPRYRVFTFTGEAKDQVEVFVHSSLGDAVAWILDEELNILGTNDDSGEATLDSHIQVTLAAAETGAFFLVFRDYNLDSHWFQISFQQRGPGAEPPGDVRQAFLDLFADGSGYLTDAHCIKPKDLPSAAKNRYARLKDLDPSRVRAWRFESGQSIAYACMAPDDEAFYVDLFDTEGRWLEHGHSFAFGESNPLQWTFDDADESICGCERADRRVVCHWTDGGEYSSVSLICPN